MYRLFSLCLTVSACGSSVAQAPQHPEAVTAERERGEIEQVSENDEVTHILLSAFLRSLAPRIGDGLYVEDGAGTARVHCGEVASEPVCAQCYAHVFESECGPAEQELLCGRVGPYARPAANVQQVDCAADGTRCWLDRLPLGNAPSGDRVTWFFKRNGPLAALAGSAFGVPATLALDAVEQEVSSACGFHAALREGALATDHVGVFVHRFSNEFDGPSRNLERHLCGEGLAEFAGGMLRELMQGEEFDECYLEPLRCEYGLDHARLVAFGRDLGVDASPRFVFDGLATIGGPLDDEPAEEQQRDVRAFHERVLSDEPAPRRRDRPFGVPALPSTIRDCR